MFPNRFPKRLSPRLRNAPAPIEPPIAGECRRFITARISASVYAAVVLSLSVAMACAAAADPYPGTILYGAAYYEEYAPYDRLDADVKLMKSAGINIVRIGESTWGTLEPQDGVFDYSHIDRVIQAMDKAGISVIVGTPTYAIPTWLARKYPDVLVRTPAGPSRYGPVRTWTSPIPTFASTPSASSAASSNT
jgi:beta-galactosidase